MMPQQVNEMIRVLPAAYGNIIMFDFLTGQDLLNL
jgi:hypothetical protein